MTRVSPAWRLVAAAFLMDFAIGVVALGYTLLAVDLHATPFQLGLVGAFGALSYTIGCLYSGRWSDRYGRRRSVVLSCLTVSLAWMAFRWVRSPLQILLVLPFSGGGMAFFWPPLQAWLAELSVVGGKAELNRNIGRFNMAWCAGLMLGPVAAGLLRGWGHLLPFYSGIACALLILAFAAVTPSPDGSGPLRAAGDEPPAEVHPQADLFLHLAWLGNFASFFATGAIKSLFPKLGSVLGFSDTHVGCLIAAIHLGQLALFVVGSRTVRWHYKLGPMLAAQVLAAAGMVLAAVTQDALVFAAAFAAVGICAGVTYVASLFYSLHGRRDDRGGKAGLHEAVLGSGALIGPVLGGKLADATTLRAPYLLAAGACLAAAAVQVWVWRHRNRAQ